MSITLRHRSGVVAAVFVVAAGCEGSTDPPAQDDEPTPTPTAEDIEDALILVESVRLFPTLLDTPDDADLITRYARQLPFAAEGLGIWTLDSIGDIEPGEPIPSDDEAQRSFAKGTPECWTVDGGLLEYDLSMVEEPRDCGLQVDRIDGTIQVAGDAVVVSLGITGGEDTPWTSYDGELISSPESLSGELWIGQAVGGGYTESFEMEFNDVMLDDEGCPVGGSVDYDTKINAFADFVTLVYGPSCGEVAFVQR